MMCCVGLNMTITIFLLCVFTRQVISQTNDIAPARIFVSQKMISEGSSLHITCSTFGSKKQTTVYVYLCKDGVGISVAMLKKEQIDAFFSIQRADHNHSGHYSCVYSRTNYEPSALNDTGSSRIQVKVISSFVPADISVAGPSTASEGDHVELRCTLSNTPQTLDECQLIQAYLRKNETIVQVQTFNVTRMEATFLIEGAVMRDSGRYSCMVLPSKCIKAYKETLYGNNSVLIQVKASLLVQTVHFSGIVSQVLLLGLCLWMIRNKCGSLTAGKSEVHSQHNPSAESQQPDTHMLEEQREQTEREDLETPDSGSFSVEEDESFQSDVESTYCNVTEEERVYSVADDSAVSTYAKTIKHKNKHSAD